MEGVRSDEGLASCLPCILHRLIPNFSVFRDNLERLKLKTWTGDERRKLRKHKTFHYPSSSCSTPSKKFLFPAQSLILTPLFNGHGPAAIKIWGQICSARNNKSYLTRSICLEVAAWTGHSGQIWFRPIEKKIPALKGRQNWRTGWQHR